MTASNTPAGRIGEVVRESFSVRLVFDGARWHDVRSLVRKMESLGQESESGYWRMPSSEIACASAEWSAQLRAKVAASAERERMRVVADYDEDWGRP
jgi:hypothetical protein